MPISVQLFYDSGKRIDIIAEKINGIIPNMHLTESLFLSEIREMFSTHSAHSFSFLVIANSGLI